MRAAAQATTHALRSIPGRLRRLLTGEAPIGDAPRPAPSRFPWEEMRERPDEYTGWIASREHVLRDYSNVATVSARAERGD